MGLFDFLCDLADAVSEIEEDDDFDFDDDDWNSSYETKSKSQKIEYGYNGKGFMHRIKLEANV